MIYEKIRILCIVDYYLPGFKGGGPIRTVANMVEQLGDCLEFIIVTRDRDLNSNHSYDGIEVDAWNDCGGISVYYASPRQFSLFRISSLLKNTDFDLLYLNSFFSVNGSIFPLVSRALGLFKKVPVIIAPRGEFSVGALNIKSFKKIVYIKVAKFFGVYNSNVYWQASSEYERNDISREIGVSMDKISIASDLLAMPEMTLPISNRTDSDVNVIVLRIAFISRISPIKNLGYLIDILSMVKSPIVFNIYGPVEDVDYWEECKLKIKMLNDNVIVRFHGGIEPSLVGAAFSMNDLFAFPTGGENFGHVIFESLRVGTPVIVSDKTPWVHGRGLSVLPLDNKKAWVDAIEKYAALDGMELAAIRSFAFEYAVNYYKESSALYDNKSLFLKVLNIYDFNLLK